MRIIEKTVYKFSELSDDARQRVIGDWRQHDEFFDGDEIVDTLRAFERNLPVSLGNWSLGRRGAGIPYTVPSFSEDYGTGEDCTVRGVRLWKYLINNQHHMVKNPYVRPGELYSKENPGFLDIRTNDCPLTGVCWDHDALDPLIAFLRDPSTFDGNWHELVGECLAGIESAYDRALEDWHSEERIIEDIENGDYEFYENGDLL